jgi:nucleotide-binding universal stress UspA family protein
MLRGTVAEQIVDYVEAYHSVVVLASRGQTGAVRWPLGGVADRILHNL